MSNSTHIYRNPVESVPQRFPFGVDFQKSLLKLLCEDPGFGLATAKYLKPHFFSDEVLAWAYNYAQTYIANYSVMPTLRVMLEHTRSLDQHLRPIYTAAIESVINTDLRDEQWLRDNTIEFIRRNIFVRAFNDIKNVWNAGDHNKAYDMMMQSAEEIRTTEYDSIDRGWIADDFASRQSARLGIRDGGDAIPTGIPWLDNIMGGGPTPGELCAWIAYAKIGKSTMLVNHGKAAARLAFKNVLHVVFEGMRSQVETRYDASFSEDLYSAIKYGNIDAKKYHVLQSEYKMLRGKLVIRGFTERWDYSVVDIHQEIKDLKQRYNWEPDLIIVDYGDLLTGRDSKGYSSETAKQRAAWRDLKSLANRGYALWSGSQAQRPGDDAEIKPHIIRSRQIADCYDKVRVCDFIGSLNQTIEEYKAKVMRIFAELYRDGEPPAEPLLVRADMSRMIIRSESGLSAPSMQIQAKLIKPSQVKAPM